LSFTAETREDAEGAQRKEIRESRFEISDSEVEISN
jgi:hypothetical protein